ncbi:annexin A8-like isoform X2 [Indicator indicator]|uniref:annexin A8-like isoform X2 n=1 Tax=Indicator indicator TaxID=1002788 RepID=UPI0023DF7DD4|nr:annexin A8-like isoform X2 [Indicator indicator]
MAWWKAWSEAEGISVIGASNFDPTPDAQTLYKAMKGLGELTPTTCVNSILLMVSNFAIISSQLTSVHSVYGLLLLSTGTDEQAIIDVLTKRTNMQRQQIAKSFKAQFGKDLIESLKSELSGNFERLIVALMYSPLKYDAKELYDAMKGERDNATLYVDTALARQDAEALYAAGEKIKGTDEEQFITILCKRSATHLLKVKCTRNIRCYFAERLYHALKGAGTDDGTLIRVIVSRSEVDLNLIKPEFKRIAGKTLSSMILDDTSGDYKTALLNLCGSD